MKLLFATFLLVLFLLTSCQQAEKIQVENALPNLPSDKVYERPNPFEDLNLPSRVLTDEQIQRAVALGEKSVTERNKIFGMKRARDVSILTPEINLALMIASEGMSPEEIENVARTDQVVFVTTLYGSYDGFQNVVNVAIYLEDGTLVRPFRIYKSESEYEYSQYTNEVSYSANLQAFFKYTALKGKRFTLKITDKTPYNIDFTNEV